MQLRALVVTAALLVGYVIPGGASSDAAEASRGIAVLDASSGDVRWTRAAPDGVTYQAGEAGNGVVVATERACAEFEGDDEPDPVLRAFDEREGSPLWHTAADGVLTRSRRSDPASEVDLGASGVAVVVGEGIGSGDRGVAVLNGARKWTGTPASYVLGASDDLVFWSGGGSSPLRATARRTGKNVFVFPSTPESAWTATFNVVAADSRTVLVANGGYGGRRGSEPAGPTTFFVLDARTGAERGRFTSADPRLLFSGVAMGHDLFAYSERGSIVARSIHDGSVAWHRSFRDQRPLITATTADMVVVATTGGRVQALDLRTGARRWAITHALVRASDEDTLIVIGTSGTDRGLRAVDMAAGKVRWSRVLPASIPGNVSEVAFAVNNDTVVLTDACDLG